MPPDCPKCGEPLAPGHGTCRSCGFTLDVPPNEPVDVPTHVSASPSGRGCGLAGGALLLLLVAGAAYRRSTIS